MVNTSFVSILSHFPFIVNSIRGIGGKTRGLIRQRSIERKEPSANEKNGGQDKRRGCTKANAKKKRAGKNDQAVKTKAEAGRASAVLFQGSIYRLVSQVSGSSFFCPLMLPE